MVGRALMVAGALTTTANSLIDVGSVFGLLNSSINWIIYAAVSKSYRRAYSKLAAVCYNRLKNNNI